MFWQGHKTCQYCEDQLFNYMLLLNRDLCRPAEKNSVTNVCPQSLSDSLLSHLPSVAEESCWVAIVRWPPSPGSASISTASNQGVWKKLLWTADTDKSHSRCTVCCCCSQISAWECGELGSLTRCIPLSITLGDFLLQSVSEHKLG